MPGQYEAALVAAVVVLTLLIVSQMGRSGEGFAVSKKAHEITRHAQRTHDQNGSYQEYKKGASEAIKPFATPVSFVKTKQLHQARQLTPEAVESMVVS